MCVVTVAGISSLSLFFWTGCSLQPKSQRTKIFIDLSEVVDQARSEEALLSLQPNVMSSPAPAPSSIAGFDCLAVNIVGPGIPKAPQDHGDEDPVAIANALLNPASPSCTYLGAHAGPIVKGPNGFPAQVELSLNVPAGPQRVIQVVGIKEPAGVVTPKVCRPGGMGADDDEGVGYYEITRRVLPSLNSSQSLAISSEWPTNDAARQSRRMNCGDGNGPVGPMGPMILTAAFNSTYIDSATQDHYSATLANSTYYSLDNLFSNAVPIGTSQDYPVGADSAPWVVPAALYNNCQPGGCRIWVKATNILGIETQTIPPSSFSVN